MANPVEVWKAEKHGFDVWDDIERYAARGTPMKEIPTPDLERMKWYGTFYRKRDGAGSYMFRIRLTGCELNAAQAKAIAYVAYELGYGIVDLTTRANIQVQGMNMESVPAALARLNAVGLTTKQTGHDNIRNVFCHPLSGVDPTEIIDCRPLCREVSDIFLDSRIYSDLPRKFNIAIHGAEQPTLHYWTQDLGFLACHSQGRVMFQLLMAGKQGQSTHLGEPMPFLLEPTEVAPLTRATLDLFREQGPREKRDASRFRVLFDKLGRDKVVEELQRRLPFPLRPTAISPLPPSGYEDSIGWFRQKDDRWAMGVNVPLGRLTWSQLEGLALAAERFGNGDLRVTPDQGIYILNVVSGFKGSAAAAVARHGLSVHADSLDRNTVACTGKQFCNIAVTETKGHAFALMEKLRQRGVILEGIRLHMSGCPSSCAMQHTADIGLKGVRVKRLLGTREGFDVMLGGGVTGGLHTGIPYKLGVDVDQLPVLIEEVIHEYYLHHRPGETFSAYWREKLARRDPNAVLEGEYRPTTWECENCKYKHMGEDPPVFCPKCAGLRRGFGRWSENLASPAPPPTPAAGPDGYVSIAELAKVPTDSGLLVTINGEEIALFREGDGVRAIANRCPHQGGSLAEGSCADGVVTCPLHSWRFRVADGAGVAPKNQRVACYPTRVENGAVLIHPTPMASTEVGA